MNVCMNCGLEWVAFCSFNQKWFIVATPLCMYCMFVATLAGYGWQPSRSVTAKVWLLSQLRTEVYFGHVLSLISLTWIDVEPVCHDFCHSSTARNVWLFLWRWNSLTRAAQRCFTWLQDCKVQLARQLQLLPRKLKTIGPHSLGRAVNPPLSYLESKPYMTD